MITSSKFDTLQWLCWYMLYVADVIHDVCWVAMTKEQASFLRTTHEYNYTV